MVIYGLSQTSGEERRLGVEKAGGDVSLVIYELAEDTERDRIMVPSEQLLDAIITKPEGGLVIDAADPELGVRKLDVEVRRNEVQLKLQGGGQGDCDIAVGLDDLQDALEGVMD